MVRDRLETRPFTSFASALSLGAAVLLYLLITAFSASRQLWHDELFTYYIAKSPSIARFWEAIHVDLNPPMSYLAVRASLAVLGDNAYATRFPSMVGFLIGSLCLYRFVSIRLRPVYGLLAMLVFWSTPFLSFGSEARPYGLVIGFFGIAMLAWQAALQPERRWFTVFLLGVAIAGMMLSHFFTIFYIAPFCVAQLVHDYRARKLNWPIWIALLSPLLVMLAYIPVVHRYQGAIFPFSFQASPAKIAGFFYRSLQPESPALLTALCVALIVGFRPSRTKMPSASLNLVDAVFVLGLLAIPIIVILAMMRSHGVAFHRYSAPAVFAYGFLFAFFVATETGISRLSAAAAVFTLFAYIVVSDLLPPVRTVITAWRAPASSFQPPFIQDLRPDLPLVAASGLTFLEMDKYAGTETVSRLFYLTDPELAIRYAHATIFESYQSLKTYFPIRGTIEPYRQFVRAHPQFLVIGTADYPEDWLLRYLLDVRAKVQYLGHFGGPYKDADLYEVTPPQS